MTRPDLELGWFFVADIVRVALRNLRAHRLRSGLTVVSVAIGVAAVVLSVGLGHGLRDSYRDYFATEATEIVLAKADPIALHVTKDLRDADVRALTDSRHAPSVAGATPVVTGSGLARNGSKVISARLAGSRPEYLSLARRALAAGVFYDEDQVRGAEQVVVLGSRVVDALFDGDAASSIGANVRIGRASFTVIGALRRNGFDDRDLLMPLTATRAYLVGRGDKVNKIVLRAGSMEQVPMALGEINRIMSERHDIRTPESADFRAESLLPMIDAASRTITQVAVNAAAVGALALLIGAVGVANIMLVSVGERTREIGIRRAVGARRRSVMAQFIVESVVLTGLGGAAGAVLGVILAVSSGPVLDQLVGRSGLLAAPVSPLAIAVAFGVSVLVGVAAGAYPAHRAAWQDPIEALRYE